MPPLNPSGLRRDWVVAPLCGAVATSSGYSKDPSRPLGGVGEGSWGRTRGALTNGLKGQ